MDNMQLFSGITNLTEEAAKSWRGRTIIIIKIRNTIYTSLDLSDNEIQYIFKPRGKQKKDKTWNPKDQVSVPREKQEQTARDSAKQESVESTLAATIVKYDNCSSNATNNLTSKRQKVCSLCYRHAETRRSKGRKRCDLFYGGECDKPTWSGET